MSVSSKLDIRDLLELLPAEPGAGPDLLMEERFDRLDRFFLLLNGRIAPCSMWIKMDRETESAIAHVYFSYEEGRFDPAYVFMVLFAGSFSFRSLEGGTHQYLGSWKDGVRHILYDVLRREQEIADAASRNVTVLSRMAAALHPDVAAAGHRSPDAASHPTNGGSPYHVERVERVEHVEWT